MAKKEKFDLDNYDFGDEFNVPEFDFDLEPPKDNRRPATKFAAGAAGGFKDQLASPETIKKVVTKALPKGYGSAINLADQAVGTYKSLYDSTAREMKPLVNDLKRSTQKILPAIEKGMPKSFAERARKWAATAEDKRAGAEADEAARRESEIAATLGTTLGSIADQDQKDRASDKADERIRDGINQSRHKEQINIAGGSAVSLARLTAFNDKVHTPYMRKSLEIQLRQYYLAMDAYGEQKKQNAIVEKGIQEITKNTGLPDYVKLQNKEYIAQVMRNKFLGGISDTLFSKRRNFLRGMGQRIIKGGQQKVKDFSDNVRGAMGAADSLAELQEMQKEFGGPGSAELGGSVVGGAAADKLAERIGKWLNGHMRKNDKVVAGGNKAQYFVENLPQIAGSWSQGYKGDDAPIIGGLIRFIKDQVAGELRGPSQSIETDNISGLQEPGIFSKRSNKSITEIIPGYLARILREVTSLRTGELAEMVEYDFTNNKFDNSSAVKKNIFKQVVEEGRVRSVRGEADKMLDALDPEKKLTEQQRRTLVRQLAKDNLSNQEGDPTKYMDASKFSQAKGADSEAFAELFKEFFKDDKTGDKKLAFSRDYNRLGESIGDHRNMSQAHINAGNLQHLIDLGIINKAGNAVDMERLFDVYLPEMAGSEAEQGGTPNRPQVRRLNQRRGGGPTPPALPNRRGPLPGPTGGNPDNGPSPLPPPAPVAPQQSFDTGLREVISESSAKSETEKVNETLLRIEKNLNDGITLHGSFGDRTGPGGRKRFGNKTIGELGSDLWGLGGKAATWTKNRFVQSGGWAKDASKWGFGKARQGWDWLSKKAEEINDIYIKGELVPRLTKAKLEAGQYFDQATGEVIKSYKEIKGNVVDENGNIVIDAAKGEIKRLFVKLPGGQKLLTSLGAFAGKVKDFGFNMARRLPGIYGMGFDLLKKGYDMVLDGPQDVYVVGKPDPVMLAVTMQAGGYASRNTSKVIRKVTDIDGPVYDHEGKIVLSAEDLAKGLLDKDGRPLKTGWRKALQWGRDKAMWGWDKLRKAGTWMKDKAQQGASWLGEKFGGKWGDGGLGISFGRSARSQARLLLDIRDMLNDRLPGERTTFAPLPEPGPELKEHLNSAKKKFGELKEKAKAKFKEKFGHIGPANTWKDGIKNWWTEGKDRRDNIKLAAQSRKDQAKGFFDTKHSQMAALFDKYFGKKKTEGDEDGDGVRDGSYKDQLKKLKEKALAAKERAKDLGTTAKDKGQSIYGKAAGGAKSLWDRLRGRGGDGEGGGGLDVDLGGDGERRPRRRRGPKKAAPKGFWNKAKHYGAKGLKGAWGLTKGALGLGASLLGVEGGLALAGTVGSAAMTAGGAILGGLGAVAGGVLSVLASPVVLGALAVAAVGAGAYFGYKYLTSKKLDKFNTPRYVQYGFPASEDKYLNAVFGLEDLVEPAVTIAEGKATLDTKKIDFDKAAETFGVDKKDSDQVTNFVRWFAFRFKPIFLTHLQVSRALGAKTLSGIGDLKPNEIKQYITGVRMPDGPYNQSTSPFPELKSLPTGASEVSAAWDALQAEIDKMPGANDPLDPKTATAAAAAGAAAAGVAAAVKGPEDPNAGPSATSPNAVDPTAITAATAAASDSKSLSDLAQSKMGISDGGSSITMTGDGQFATAFDFSRIDALTAIRYKAYGLNEMAADKIRSLYVLEQYVTTRLTFKRNVATWDGLPERAMAANGPNFGVEPGGGKDATDWMNWFRFRFMPVFLNYATAVNTAAGRFDPRAAEGLKGMDKIAIATAMTSSKSTFNESDLSVWAVPTSPWPGYTLNSDSKSIEPNMTGLREQAKKALVPEETSKAKTSDASAEAAAGAEGADKGIWGGIKAGAQRALDTVGKFVPDFVKNAYSGAKEAMGFGGGREIDQPGKGTGGDINDVPKPTGNGSWAALKDTIMAAAKMVGVDDKLMAAMAAIESSFNYKAKAGTSSASGLFQFINKTWKGMLKKFGPKYGIDPNTDQMDPRANALMGAEYIKENASALKSLGRPLTDTDLYLAHFLGSGDAKKLLSADPSAIAAQLLPDAAAANKTVFYRNGQPVTVGEVYQWAQNAVKSKASKFGVDTGSEKVVSGSPAGSKSADGPTAAVTGTTMPGVTPGTANADKPSDNAPKTTTNPIGNFPVADQSPIPKSGDGEMQTVVVKGTRLPKNDQASAPSSAPDESITGIMSPRALDVNANQQYQRDQTAEVLKALPGIAKEHLDVSKEMLGVMKDLRDTLKTVPKGVMEKPVQPVTPAAPAPSRNQRPQNADPVPVSMSKAAAMNESKW